MTNTPTTTEQLANHLRGKRQVLEQLHQVGLRQGELIESGDVGSLLKLLAAKQRLLAALQAVEKRIVPYRDQDPEARAWPSADARAACAADAEACRQLLAGVVEMERSHERAMTERRDRVAQRLKRAHTAHGASGAYKTHCAPQGGATPRPAPAAPVETTPAGIDLTSEA